MTERLVCIGVHPEILKEILIYKEKGDFLTQEMLDDTVDEIIDELHFLGAVDKKVDRIHVSFQNDENADPNSPYRVIKVKEPIYDELEENIIGEREESYMFHFETDSDN